MLDPRDLPTDDDVDVLNAVLTALLRRTLPGLMDIDAEEADDIVEQAIIAFVTSKPSPMAAPWVVFAATATLADHTAPHSLPLRAPEPPDSTAPPRLARVLATLSPRERDVVRLALVQKCSVAEIAEALEITPAYAKKLVLRVVSNIRKRLQELP